MSRFIFVASFLLASCVPDCGSEPPAPDGGAGHGGAPEATVATSSSAGGHGGSGGASFDPDCIDPAPRHYLCARASDCYDVSPCTEDACLAADGTPCPDGAPTESCECAWTQMANGVRRDVGPNGCVCQEGSCCLIAEPRQSVSP